jgi:hypothetical protein
VKRGHRRASERNPVAADAPSSIEIPVGSSVLSFELAPVLEAVRGKTKHVAVSPKDLSDGLIDVFQRAGILRVPGGARDHYQVLTDEEGVHRSQIQEVKALALEINERINHPAIRKLLNELEHQKSCNHETVEECLRFPREGFVENCSSQLLRIAELAGRTQTDEIEERPLGHPLDEAIDELLWRLAELFSNLRGSKARTWYVPHAVKSVFIGFAFSVLSQLFHPSKVSPKALSERWIRIKRSAFNSMISEPSRSQNPP